MPKSVTDFIYQCGSVPFNGNGKKRWMAVCGATLWTIWITRNDSVFNGKKWKGEEVVFLCKLRAFHWINAMEKSEGVGEEGWWSKPWASEKCSKIVNPGRLIGWVCPQENILKFNVDGAVSGSTKKAGCGGVLRDSNGRVRGVFYGSLGEVDSNIVEMMAIKTALQVFLFSPWANNYALIIESDSKLAVDWIKKQGEKTLEGLESV